MGKTETQSPGTDKVQTGLKTQPPKVGFRPGVACAKALVGLYRYAISPVMPPACRFVPSCSSYALEAYERHGVIRGSYLTMRRLLRCHPWGRSGYDPVPRCCWKRCTHSDPLD